MRDEERGRERKREEEWGRERKREEERGRKRTYPQKIFSQKILVSNYLLRGMEVFYSEKILTSHVDLAKDIFHSCDVFTLHFFSFGLK